MKLNIGILRGGVKVPTGGTARKLYLKEESKRQAFGRIPWEHLANKSLKQHDSVKFRSRQYSLDERRRVIDIQCSVCLA